MDKRNHDGMKDTMDHKFMPMFSLSTGAGQEVVPGVYYYTNQIVNLCCIGTPDDWVLVDAGMPESAERIVEAIEREFGHGARPRAIILTHGHFDHVGSLVDLVDKWKVPVYAHEAELPYLTGKESYPEPDGSVEGGLVAKMSPKFPNEPIDLGSNVEPLPADGNVPHLPDWQWVHTPGHTPGHISLFREHDRTLIAGDAFVTVKQESLYKVVTQKKEVSGPPRYLTTDWDSARASVEKLEALKPATAITGHGQPLIGKELAQGLEKLVRDFDKIAVPDYGRNVKRK
ncbi:MBL fold metallo-hydrolase [Halobacillus sp. B23F22_1]|uniref:MBL fold metallo-hydrolase n=1 Tax=Halobacillus sp. B23F22_1 TaxID=3459514 RepID=UPI00373F8597